MKNDSLDISLLSKTVSGGSTFSGSALDLVLRDLARGRRCRAAHANSLAEDEFVDNNQGNEPLAGELH